MNKSPDHDAQIVSGKHCDDKLDTKGEVSFTLDPMLEPVECQPPPLNNAQSQKIISDFCANSSKSSIEEAGCGVCGQLVPTVQLTRLKAVKNILNMLQADVTRIQRFFFFGSYSWI